MKRRENVQRVAQGGQINQKRRHTNIKAKRDYREKIPVQILEMPHHLK